MRQLLIPEQAGENSFITIRGKEYHYLSHVLRLKPGDTFQGIDNKGRTYLLKLHNAQKDALQLKVLSGKRQEDTGCDISLLQCLLKGKKMDVIMRMASEIGVKEIIPVISEYTVMKEANIEQYGNKLKRWQKILREALQQSGAASLTGIVNPVSLNDLLAAWNFAGISLFCHQIPIACSSLHKLLDHAPDKIAVLIGPEGGFSEQEVALLMDKGFVPINLGPNILRTETAAVFTLAAIKIVLLEKGTWKLQQKK
jgi:16S rRNA (uracil1498-N3)-methyltransferase